MPEGEEMREDHVLKAFFFVLEFLLRIHAENCR
jgi:hypothetical protein